MGRGAHPSYLLLDGLVALLFRQQLNGILVVLHCRLEQRLALLNCVSLPPHKHLLSFEQGAPE